MYANIYRLVGNTFLIRTVAGWRKMLKYFGCYKHPNHWVHNIFSESYPFRYPVLVHCQDSLFEEGNVYVTFRYISKEMANQLVQNLNLKPVTELPHDE